MDRENQSLFDKMSRLDSLVDYSFVNYFLIVYKIVIIKKALLITFYKQSFEN